MPMSVSMTWSSGRGVNKVLAKPCLQGYKGAYQEMEGKAPKSCEG